MFLRHKYAQTLELITLIHLCPPPLECLQDKEGLQGLARAVGSMRSANAALSAELEAARSAAAAQEAELEAARSRQAAWAAEQGAAQEEAARQAATRSAELIEVGLRKGWPNPCFNRVSAHTP